MRLFDLLRDSAEDYGFDWKDRHEDDAKKKRNPRTKLVKPKFGNHLKSSKSDKLDLNKAESFEQFEDRAPAKVHITPTGKHDEAVFKPSD